MEGKIKSALKRLNNIKGNPLILLLPIIIAGFGVIMVYSASCYSAAVEYNDAYYFAKKQLIGFILGIVGMVIAGRCNIEKLKGKKVRYFVLCVAVVLLALVFVPGLGKTNYGATRWIGIGGITIQPSELAKYALVLFSASYMSENMGKMRTFQGMLPVLCAGGIICVLIILEPNMSVTMCVGVVMLAMLFLGGTKIKHFLCILAPALLVIPVLIISEPYRLLRMSAFLDPWASPKEEGYQLIQSLYALGNGGWFGTGLFNSRQKYRFLPFAESDFILAIIGEEIGFIGLIILFLASFLLICQGVKIASEATDFFSYLLSSGITIVYAVQTTINALVVSGAIPPTGIPLPLISSGNTALIITMTSFGFLYSISRRNKIKIKEESHVKRKLHTIKHKER